MAQNYNPFKSTNIKFADNFFPARPQEFWIKARQLAQTQIDVAVKIGLPNATNPSYVRWLKRESMLMEANKLSRKYIAKGMMWQNPFARPRPKTAIGYASVWYTAYPVSLITKPKTSILSTLGDDKLWDAFQSIGINAIHTGPMKYAGGIKGWDFTPSIDGHFDRISNKIDGIFGGEKEYKQMSDAASKHGAIIIDDIVPGHTGKGADFRLATMNYGDYPGIYHMVEIAPEDWHLLPEVQRGHDSINLNVAAEERLKQQGYIIGKMQRVIFYEPGVKETNWSATKVVRGTDGIKRRWVYLHYFKEGQPSINWLDPSFAGMRLVIGDALHSIGTLGAKALRLDANGFLGIEKSSEDQPAWSEGHPLSEAANQVVSSMVRKLGGFTFQELNLSLDDMKVMSEYGADLSYDFINRPAYHHALATSDTEFLRLMLKLSMDIGIKPVSLVHAMQNHDELTLELIHFWTHHKDEQFDFRNKKISGIDLREVIRKELFAAYTGGKAMYNLPAPNGIACTTASAITAVLSYDNIHNLTTDQIESVKQVHLLLAMFNALQPGVFAISGWDLCGSMTLEAEELGELLSDGDTRWANRGSYDLMNVNPGAKRSFGGMPKATSIYGSIAEQLDDNNSFVSQLKRILSVRKQYGIATAEQLDIPEVSHEAMLVMVHQLNDERMQVTVLNFSNQEVTGSVSSEYLPPGAKVISMWNNEQLAQVDNLHTFYVTLPPYNGVSLLIDNSKSAQ